MCDLFVAKMQVTVIYCAGEKCQQSMANEVKKKRPLEKTNSCCSQDKNTTDHVTIHKAEIKVKENPEFCM